MTFKIATKLLGFWIAATSLGVGYFLLPIAQQDWGGLDTPIIFIIYALLLGIWVAGMALLLTRVEG